MFIVPISQLPSIQTVGEAQNAVNSAQKPGVPFADVLSDAMQNMQETQAVSQQDAYELAMGTSDDLHTVAIHSQQAAAAMDLAVQLTTRAVAAYKEVLQMQV